MKKILSSILVLCMSVPLASASFTDVATGSQYYAAITYLQEKGVIEGYTDGSFKPDQDVTRAEALKLILVGSGITIEELTTYEFPFSDLENDAWYLKYINKGYELEIISGYEDGTFKPNQNVNLVEALKMLLIAKGVDLSTVPVETSDWFEPYTAYAENLNLIELQDDGLLHPDQTLSRAEISEIIYRLMYVEENDLESFDISLNWQSYQNELGYGVKYPYGWQVVTNSDGSVVLWNQDEENGQETWAREYPNSASVTLAIYKNTDSLDSVIETMQEGGYEEVSEITVGGNPAVMISHIGDVESEFDCYVFFPSGQVFAMFGSYGKGALALQSYEEVYAVEMSAVYVESAVTTPTEWDAILEEARSLIQVDGQGAYALSLFTDKVLIETDTIGVGTGPVDYYYSVGADVTLKYERSYDVVLDIMDGSTSAF
ncbi:MAG: S-layer homology domain-containing protein [Candidatus Gracilibacteria bacterium]|jgi:hypothetical protein